MPVTLVLLVVTCVVSILAFRNARLGQLLVMWPPAISRQHQYHRLLSYGLVHADAQHLIFNMVTLFFFGMAVEGFFARYMGAAGFVLFYMGGLLVSIVPSYMRHRDDARYVSLGASGAVSAVLFAFILLHPWSMIFVFFIPMPAILYAVGYVGFTIYMERRGGDRINHSAHLWGAGYGVLFAVAMEPRLWPAFLQQLLHPPFIG